MPSEQFSEAKVFYAHKINGTGPWRAVPDETAPQIGDVEADTYEDLVTALHDLVHQQQPQFFFILYTFGPYIDNPD